MKNIQFTVHSSQFAIILLLVTQIISFHLKGQSGSPDTIRSFCSFQKITNSNSGSSGFQLIGSYTASQIQQCGKFEIYYEDMLLGNNWGFDNSIVGNLRKATLCQVLTDLQAKFDFSSVPLIDKIRIEITSSYETPIHPAPPTVKYLAAAGPNFPAIATNTPGFYGGLVYDKINNYATYSNSGFDGSINFNFSSPFHNDYNTLPGICEYDLYSITLHEVLHLLGWFSLLEEDANHFPVQNTSSGLDAHAFSKLDEKCLFHGDITTGPSDKWVLPGAVPQINSALNYANSMRDNQTYLGNLSRFHDNHPVYCGFIDPYYYNASPDPSGLPLGQIFTHMEGQKNASNRKYWLTPGFRAKYIMEPFISVGISKRDITNIEIRTLMLMGYGLNPVFASSISPISSTPPAGTNTTWGTILSTNHKPECTTDFSCLENGAGVWFDPNPNLKEWADGTNSGAIPNVTVDFPIKQNDGTPLDIDLNSMPLKLVDYDGDIITVIPSSITGIRGVSNGDNNHGCLSVINNNQTIRYLPRPDFLGRAQFYCQLFDGKEVGTLALFTIDVVQGIGFTNIPANEMIINGDFEEGTEVKDINSIANTTKEGNFDVLNTYEGQFYEGFAFADAHPLWHLNTLQQSYPYTNLGLVINNSFSGCTNINTPGGFGGYYTTFPNPPMGGSGWATPNSFNGVGVNRRYAQFSNVPGLTPFRHTNYSTLSSAPINGTVYKLECDIFFPDSYADLSLIPTGLPTGWNIDINFTDQFDLFNPVNCFSKTMDLGLHNSCMCLSAATAPITGQWEHVTKYFQYCCNQQNPAIKYMELIAQFRPASSWSPFHITYIDNLSLTPSTYAAAGFTINAISTVTSNCFNHQLDVKMLPEDLFCNLSFSWSPATYLTNTNIQNPLALNVTAPITYTVTVTDGYGSTFTSTVSISPQIIPTAVAYPNIVCQGNSVTLVGSGGGTAATYTWTGGTGIVNNTPFVPSGSATYTVTISEPGGCTATTSVSVTVTPPPTITASASLPALCPGGNLVLTASGANTYLWTNGPGFIVAGNPVTVNTPGTYTVTGTDINGCSASTTLVVVDGSFIASITGHHCVSAELEASPYDPLAPSLYSYVWSGPTGSITPPTNPFQNTWGVVSTQGTYTVVVTNTQTGCTSTATFILSSGPDFTTSGILSGTPCANITASLSVNFVSAVYPPYTFQWTPGAFLPSNSSNPVTSQALTGAANYQVIVTDGQSCSKTGSVHLNPQMNFCCSEEGYDLALDPLTIRLDNVNASTIPPFGIAGLVLPFGQVLYINGTYQIDQSMSFTNTHFYFTPDSKIVLVGTNSSLYLNNCTFETPPHCDMWDGIYADNSTQSIYITNCTFRDMKNGVNVSNNALLSSIGGFYFDNYIGIQLKNNTLASTCVVKNNTFSKQAVLLKAPYIYEGKPRYGIIINRCDNISIGDINNVNSTNKFEDMWTGIYINGVPSSAAANIFLCHNRFNKIQGDGITNTWGTAMNTTNRGWAVYAIAPSPSNLTVTLNEYPSSTTINFENCDKGILLRRTSGIIYNQKMNKTVVGVSLIEGPGKSFKVYSNNILNTELGISKVGDESSTGFYVYNNTISLVDPLAPGLLNLTAPAVPTGIYSAYSSTAHMGRSYIYGNPDITIPLPDNGIGISLATGVKDFIETNHIHLTSSTGNSALGIPQLVGIFCNNNLSLSVSNNVIDNNFSVTGNTAYVPGNNAGIYLNFNPNSLLRCNTSNYTMYGAFAAGQSGSSTDHTRTVGNTMNASLSDYMLFPLMTEGSLGQIGKFDPFLGIKFDANNTFQGPTLLNKVFRFTTSCASSLFIDQIATTPSKLTQAQSSSTASGVNNCRVEVPVITQPFTKTFACSDPYQSLAPIDDIDVKLAKDVADNQIIYEDFDEGARRAYEEMIYAWLQANDSIRLSSPLLDSFYLNRYSQIVGDLNRLDNEIAMLSDSTLMTDTAAWNTQWQLALMHNQMLGMQQVFEVNAQWINNLYLQSLKEGIENISENLEGIELLANTCPYLGGNAVYRARTLLGMFSSGIHYDDVVLCNSQGVYKNGISKLQGMLNQLEQLKSQNEFEERGVSVYPNPASNNVEIQYTLDEHEQANLIFYDVLGNKVKEIVLDGDVLIKSIYVGDLASGLYIYHFNTTKGRCHFGKLTIE